MDAVTRAVIRRKLDALTRAVILLLENQVVNGDPGAACELESLRQHVVETDALLQGEVAGVSVSDPAEYFMLHRHAIAAAVVESISEGRRDELGLSKSDLKRRGLYAPKP